MVRLFDNSSWSSNTLVFTFWSLQSETYRYSVRRSYCRMKGALQSRVSRADWLALDKPFLWSQAARQEKRQGSDEAMSPSPRDTSICCSRDNNAVSGSSAPLSLRATTYIYLICSSIHYCMHRSRAGMLAATYWSSNLVAFLKVGDARLRRGSGGSLDLSSLNGTARVSIYHERSARVSI